MKIIEKIKALNFPEKQFLILGGGILEVKNIRPTRDLDIVVTENLMDVLRKDKTWSLKKVYSVKDKIVELLCREGVEVCTSVHSVYDLDYFLQNKDRYEEIEGVYFSSLKDLLRMKSVWKREKDLVDIELINKYLDKSSL